MITFRDNSGASGWIKYNITNLYPFYDYEFHVKCRTDKGDGIQAASITDKTAEYGMLNLDCFFD